MDRCSPSANVLIIDDNRDLALSTKLLLSQRGHHVWVAHTGRDGVELARRIVPDVVICDIGLPGMTGYEVAQQLRADPALGSTRLFALSAYKGERAEQDSLWVGFERHLVKPLDPERLFAIVESCCGVAEASA